MDLSVFEESNVGHLKKMVQYLSDDKPTFCRVTMKDGRSWDINGLTCGQSYDRGLSVMTFDKSKLEDLLKHILDNTDPEEVEEFDNSWGGIVAMCDNINNSELKDAILHRIGYISSAEKRVQEAEARLEALKFDLNNHKNGLKHIINFKKLEYPVMIDDPNNYYEVSQNGEQIYIKTITKQL